MKKLIFILIVMMIASGVEAQRRRARRKKVPKKELKPPSTAASFALIPGGGQFYNGEISKGILFAAGGLLSLACMLHTEEERFTQPDTSETIYPGRPDTVTQRPLFVLGLLGLLTVWGGGAADAYFSAININEEIKGKHGMKIELYPQKLQIKLAYRF